MGGGRGYCDILVKTNHSVEKPWEVLSFNACRFDRIRLFMLQLRFLKTH